MISLCSFPLKAVERILDDHIKALIVPALLHAYQHAYTRGKLVDTALHCLNSRLEKSRHIKEYTLAIFLDIEGVFYIVDLDAIVRTLGSGRYIIRFIELPLKPRLMTSPLGATNCQ